jgi:GGDEF domain-containing protein
MALQGSFSGGTPKSHKLSKMSSVPTTEDLRYALAECKKHGKPIEMPFENNRYLFVIKVQQSGNATPKWTFIRGDGGPSSKIVWTRDSADVMMIQNKIKTESAYDSIANADNQSSGYQAPYVPEYEQSGEVEQFDGYADESNYASSQQIPAASMGFGGAPGGGVNRPPSQPGGFGGGIPSKGFGDLSTSQQTQAWNPQANANQAAQERSFGSIPQQAFSEQSASGRQAPFQPSGVDPQNSNSKILMPPKLAGFDSAEFNASMRAQGQQPSQTVAQQMAESQQIAPVQQVSGQMAQYQPQTQTPTPNAAPYADPVYQGSNNAGDVKKVNFDMSGIFGNQQQAPDTTSGAVVSEQRLPAEPATPKMPLPAPVTFDPNMINAVSARLLDSRTGLMLFDSFLFFLMKEYSRFEKNKTGFSFLICEVALKQNNQSMPLPAEALLAIGQRISSVLSPADCAAYINGSDFALMVSTADPWALKKFGESLWTALTSTPLLPGWPENSAVVAIGAASIPHTCDQVGVVVSAAQAAKESAKGMAPSFIIFNN